MRASAGMPPGGCKRRLARSLLGLGFRQWRPRGRACGAMAALGVLGLSPIPEEFRDRDVEASPHPQLAPRLVRPAGSSAAPPAPPMVTKARRLLNQDVRVGVQDGRVFVGKLHCLDKQKNIILYDTVEFRSCPGHAAVGGDAKPAAEQRSLGLVLIPAWCRTSCYVKCSFDEKLDFLNIRSR